jgi:putative ABC transport system ATP-binding protein
MSDDRASNITVRLEGVHKSYGDGRTGVPVSVLRGASMLVHSGRFVVLFGYSGSGKTTLLNIIAGLLKADRGVVQVAGQDLTRLDTRHLTAFRGKRVSYVLQQENLIDTLTASENVQLGLEAKRSPPATLRERLRDYLDRHTRAREYVAWRERAREYLGRVGLEDKAGRFPNELSGGEQQRVAIARALARQPEILLADEPTGNLDEVNARRVIRLLEDLWRRERVTTIVATHNPMFNDVAETVYHISNGDIVAA